MTLSRRGFLRGTAAGAAGLAIAFYVPTGPKVARAEGKPASKTAPPPLPPANAFVRIGTDDRVTVVLAHSEMGQSIWTSLAILVAEELECDWSKVGCEHALAAPVYGHPLMGIQMTGGSASTHGEFTRYRTVGAMAKDMLLRAAAARWKVPVGKLTAKAGIISLGTNGKQTLRFGEVAEAANKLVPPTSVKLKEPKDWKIIGTPVKRLDTPEKIDGTAKFGMDVQFTGLRTAVVARPPSFGGSVTSVDDSAAKRIAGVEQVVRTATGVAVVATNYWAAKLGRDALKIDWQAPAQIVDSTAQLADYRAKARTVGALVTTAGDVEASLGGAAQHLEVEYDVPYLAHAPMEPLNCAVKIDGDKAETWTGSQFQTVDQGAAARVLGTTPDKVTLHTMFLGGGFGRRANPASDFIVEACEVAKAAGVPVKTVWTREDDIKGGYYRPQFVHRIRAGLDAAGVPAAWDHVVVGQSIIAGTPFAAMIKDGIDETSVEGVKGSPYLDAVKSKRVSLHSPQSLVPVLWWRSVGNTHTAFAMESMIDELAHLAKQDPLAYRLKLLAGKSRYVDALTQAAQRGGWGTAAPAGRARGLAIHESFGSIVAECAEVGIEKRGGRESIRVYKVSAVVDCGTPVNPLGVEAQIQSSIAYGLSAALYGKVTLTRGLVDQSNFHDYPVMRMAQMPEVDVHIIKSGAPMGGIGEPATAPIAPAVANAVFALTGQRLRSLPLTLGGAA